MGEREIRVLERSVDGGRTWVRCNVYRGSLLYLRSMPYDDGYSSYREPGRGETGSDDVPEERL